MKTLPQRRYGASWGSTLGLAYAEAYPARVRAMVLAGVTTTRRSEIDWLYRGMAPLLPAQWERFRAGVPAGTKDRDLVAVYGDLLFDPDPAVRAKAARDFHDWDTAAVSTDPNAARPARWSDPAYVLARARIVTHYFRHGAWLEVTAWELSKAWPDARLVVIEGAGHSSSDAGMGEAIVAALDAFAVT